MENLNIEEIKAQIENEIYYFEELDSTQDYSKNKKDIEDGAIVITDNQTDGKGTHGRIWNTDKNKNITMTIVLKPMCNINKLEGITIHIAELIKNAIYNLYGYELQIKEPNDLILNNRKICGILTECTSNSNIVKSVYIGIGFNVNQDIFVKEIEGIATSLKKEYGRDFNREDIIIEIIKALNEDYTAWSEE